MMRLQTPAVVMLVTTIALIAARCGAASYPIVDTGQSRCYGDRGPIEAPGPGEPFYGQDAQHQGNAPVYRDNKDGTTTDLITGLTWVKARGQKLTWDDAVAGAAQCRAGGHADWRMPTIKELYSLINFNGGCWNSAGSSVPYIDTKYFDFVYGDESRGERIIDSQDWSATQYIGTTMGGNPTVFGVNFADGRIKGYPKSVESGRRQHRLYVRYVRGNPAYGRNDFQDNGDGTITDRATGLVWQKADSGKGMNWKDALRYAAGLKLGGHADWRLPNAKELQSLADYTRVPAIDPIFQITKLEKAADGDYPFFWTGTTHLDGPPQHQGSAAVYVCFGKGTGWMKRPPNVDEYRLLDVHGAGAQRSDPKMGDPSDYPHGRGPQGDVVRINNFVRCVRGGAIVKTPEIAAAQPSIVKPRESTTGGDPMRDPGARPLSSGQQQGPETGYSILRRFQTDPMNLTAEQKQQIADLDRQTKQRLQKILSPEQMKTLEEARPPRPGGSGGPGFDGPGGGGRPPEGGASPNNNLRGESPPGDASRTTPIAAANRTTPGGAASVSGGDPATPAESGPAAVSAARPNVLILVADDLGWGDVGFHKGAIPTPNLDRLAKEGVELSRFYAYPVCSPTRAALLTGQMPRRFGIVSPLAPRDPGIPAEIATLPGAFRSAGYSTALVGKWHVGAAAGPLRSGFDHFYGFMGPEVDYFKHTNQRGRVDWQRDGQTVEDEGYSTFLLADEAVRQIKSHEGKRPFFLEVAFNAPHFPLSAPEEYLVKHKGRGAGATYAAVVDAMDAAIGRVLSAIDERGLRDQTLVLFFSDNGADRFGTNGPLRKGKGSVFDGGIRTPCVVRWPGRLTPGTVSQQPVSAQDLFPTLAAAAGISLPQDAKLDGISMWASLRDGQAPAREPFLIATRDYALFDGPWKLIETHEGRRSLYRISSDESETSDELSRQPEVAQRLTGKLAELKKGLPTVVQEGLGGGPGQNRPPGGRPGQRQN